MQGTLKIVIIAENHRVGIEGSGDSDFFFSGHIHRFDSLIKSPLLFSL